MSKRLRVLIAEDNEDDTLLLVRALTQGGFEPEFESVVDYIDPKDENKFASYLLFPTEKERQEYIRVRRRRIIKTLAGSGAGRLA